MSHPVASLFRPASTSIVLRPPLQFLAMAALCGMGLLTVAGCGGNRDRPALARSTAV